jgi:hypothetical protein
MMSVVVPNAISNGQTLATIQVLMNGLLIEQFDSDGTSLGESFTNNPAWVLLDVLRRSGWLTTDVDLSSFATAARIARQAIETTDLYGNPVDAAVQMQPGGDRTARARRRSRSRFGTGRR